MTFEQMLCCAKSGDHKAVLGILDMYRPLLIKYAIINGRLDEDLYLSAAPFAHARGVVILPGSRPIKDITCSERESI